MISVSEAFEHLLSLVAPLGHDAVPLADAAGRTLARPVAATRDQPPFAGSAMDGYAVPAAEAQQGAMFKVIGESAAGHGFAGRIGAGQAARIFTGAPLPDGAARVIIQEDVSRSGDVITIVKPVGKSDHVRPAGADFRAGDTLDPPRRLGPSDIALLAAMNIPDVPVARRPVVALLATGNELVMPGDAPGPDQIIASNSFGLKALLEEAGAEARMLPIARDTEESIMTAFSLAAGADLVVTIGGASVGDHDLIAPVTERLGMERAFYKVAMRPGKPLMAGRLSGAAMVGLPGNPVSSMVCAHIFILPMIRRMLGFAPAPAPRRHATLTGDLAANGPREHYMRARLDGTTVTPFARQDSALLSVLADANALILRPPNDPARDPGAMVKVIPLTAY